MTHPAQNIQEFYKPVEMPGGWQHCLSEQLKTTELYYLGKYKTGQYDGNFRKFFYNISKPACDIAVKFIDLDSKDVLLLPERSEDEWAVWLLSRELKQWMKEIKFGSFLNEIIVDYPKYGHIVVKRVEGKIKRVKILNLRTDPRARYMRESGYTYELHEWNREMMKKYFNLSEVDQKLGKKEKYLVYEEYIKDGDVWKRTFLADCFAAKQKNGQILHGTEANINNQEDYLPPIKSKTETVTKFPYYELKWEELPGRWLGFGFVEYLEDNQVSVNEAENLERKALMFKALNVWASADESIAGQNALSDMDNGDILHTQAEIFPLPKDNSDLSAYNNARQNWRENTERKTFTSDITTGANLPSRTPLGVANLQAQLATSYFDLKRENLGLFIKELLSEVVIPDLLKSKRKKHLQVFLGSDEDIERLHNTVVRSKTNAMIARHVERTGFAPSKIVTDDFKQQILDQLKETTQMYVDIDDEFYENAKYAVDVLVTGESVDVNAKSQILSLALQIKQGNPQIDQDPMGKHLLNKLLSLGGISPVDFNLMQPAQQQEPVQGGSISAPDFNVQELAQPQV